MTQDEKKTKYMIEECGYDEEYAADNVEDCYIYEGMTLKELAKEFLLDGFFGGDAARVYEENPLYFNIDFIAHELGYDYVEHDGDIYRCD